MSKSTLLAATALVACAQAIALPAFAQEAAASDEQERREETVVVTGSRIARDPNLISAVPVETVDVDDLRLSGSSDPVELINELPSLLNSVAASESIDSGFSTGQATLNLRGLGAVRTLVLVDGRRHIGGVGGSSIVDVSSIPSALIERVDVLTGGAGAVYGSDAVTGVVNFILKDSFEGFQADARGNISDAADGGQWDIALTYGKNFAGGRGNFTVSGQVNRQNEITFGDRSFSRNNGIADDLPNPALRFQAGDISGSTPNFQQFFNLDNGLFPTGFSIPDADSFLADFADTFGFTPTLTAAELALFERAANAPSRAIMAQPTFSISSNRGVIAPGDFSDPGLDLDNNGVSDCLQSSVGFNSLFDFSGSFGAEGGCFVVNDDGSVRAFEDGLIAGLFNQFGGDGIANNFDPNFLTPDIVRFAGNVSGRYDVTDNIRAFVEAKFVHQNTDSGGPLNTFYDLLTVAPDNPFIPAQLQGVADAAGGLFITRDPTDLGPNINTNVANTFRVVGGLKGAFLDDFQWELSGNFGRYDLRLINRNAVIVDRFFAAIDATTDAAGNPICRSDIDGNAPPTTPFDIPLFDPAFLTFNPGDGQCRPANILGGPQSISQEAVDFITTTDITTVDLRQLVFNGFISGTTDKWFKLPGGAIGFATGFEYRSEDSSTTFSGLNQGILPVAIADVTGDGSLANVPAGTFLTDPVFQGDPDVEGDELLRQNSLLFDPASLIRNSEGNFNVWELFGEVQLPLVRDLPLIKSFQVNGAARYANYSIAQVGGVFTWNVSAEWTVVDDLRFRAGFARPIRAPNISELFDPEQGAFFRPIDPCAQAEIDALISAGDPRGPVRAANCLADGIPTGFVDPLSARFSGITSGNPDLEEERARTFTAGGIFQPRFLKGFTLTADYWNIEIEDAIAAVSAQDIVDNCYDSANFPNQFCDLFSRNRDPASPQFLGFDFLQQVSINFARLEASGVDFTAAYSFGLFGYDFNLNLSASRALKLDNFFDPGDPTAVDTELGELRRPRWSGNLNASVARGPLTVNWNTQYLGPQALRGVEIETADLIFGPAGIAGDTFIHDLSVDYQVSERLRVFGGVNNVSEVRPFITEQAFPASPLGRVFFLGVSFRQ